LYIFIFLGKIFRQQKGMASKRKKVFDEGDPPTKKARLIQLEEGEQGPVDLLGNSTSTAHSNFLLNGKEDDKNDVVLVVGADKGLLWEMVELLNDLKFEISTYVKRDQ
jgi:hypothetical protein